MNFDLLVMRWFGWIKGGSRRLALVIFKDAYDKFRRLAARISATPLIRFTISPPPIDGGKKGVLLKCKIVGGLIWWIRSVTWY